MKALTNADVRKALKGSIKKWKGIVAGTMRDQGSDNCPLCKVFLYSSYHDCVGCPVSVDTGEDMCRESPYIAWDNIAGYSCKAVTNADKKAAQAELNYLISLDRKFFGDQK